MVYLWGQAIKVPTVLEATILALGWTVALLVCKQHQGDFPNDTRLGCLLMALLDI